MLMLHYSCDNCKNIIGDRKLKFFYLNEYQHMPMIHLCEDCSAAVEFSLRQRKNPCAKKKNPCDDTRID